MGLYVLKGSFHKKKTGIAHKTLKYRNTSGNYCNENKDGSQNYSSITCGVLVLIV